MVKNSACYLRNAALVFRTENFYLQRNGSFIGFYYFSADISYYDGHTSYKQTNRAR